jgi:hypothetical protein
LVFLIHEQNKFSTIYARSKLMKLKLYLVFLMTIGGYVHAHSQTRLDMLIENRELLHHQWKNSEGKKTGIFGNRTKKDLTETIHWMEGIVQMDNEIIEELHLIKEREKTDIIYEKDDYKFISHKLERDVQTLKRALAAKDEDIRERENDKRTFEWISLLFFLSTVLFGILWLKNLSIGKSRNLE